MVDFMDDKQLLGELKRGNNVAFEFLFKSYYPRLRGYAIRFIEDEEVAYLFKKAKFIVYPYRSATMSGVLSLAYYFNKKVLASTIPFFEDNATLNVVLFKVNDIDDLERKMKSLIFGKNLSVDPTSYLNIYGEGTLINSYWGLYED